MAKLSNVSYEAHLEILDSILATFDLIQIDLQVQPITKYTKISKNQMAPDYLSMDPKMKVVKILPVFRVRIRKKTKSELCSMQ